MACDTAEGPFKRPCGKRHGGHCAGRASIACSDSHGRWACQAKECGPACPHELPPNARATGEWAVHESTVDSGRGQKAIAGSKPSGIGISEPSANQGGENRAS